MQTSNTALFFLEDDCIRAFGQETGCTLLQQAEELYQDLCQHGNDRGNHVIEEHIQSRLFPLMSYYKALFETWYSRRSGIVVGTRNSTQSCHR